MNVDASPIEETPVQKKKIKKSPTSEKSYQVLVGEELYTKLVLAKCEYLKKEKKSISIKKLLDLYFEGDELAISLLQRKR